MENKMNDRGSYLRQKEEWVDQDQLDSWGFLRPFQKALINQLTNTVAGKGKPITESVLEGIIREAQIKIHKKRFGKNWQKHFED